MPRHGTRTSDMKVYCGTVLARISRHPPAAGTDPHAVPGVRTASSRLRSIFVSDEFCVSYAGAVFRSVRSLTTAPRRPRDEVW